MMMEAARSLLSVDLGFHADLSQNLSGDGLRPSPLVTWG